MSECVSYTSTNTLTSYDRDVFKPVEFTSRIAGVCAGTKLNKSITYLQLPEVLSFDLISRQEMDKAINEGQLILYNDGEKIKIARGVTTFTDVDTEQGEQFKKIKLVEAMHLIHDDIKRTCEDTYIGKYVNTYANKCVLITAINSYFRELEKDGVLNPDMENICEIDIDNQYDYLKSIGVDVHSLNETTIKTYDTGDKVFLKASISLLDVMESIVLDITI